MEKFFGGMGKSGMLDPKRQAEMKRNPQQMMRQMAKGLDPNMMRGMGGPQGMMNLMKGLDPSILQNMMGGGGGGGGGGMPDMGMLQNLMKNFGGGRG